MVGSRDGPSEYWRRGILRGMSVEFLTLLGERNSGSAGGGGLVNRMTGGACDGLVSLHQTFGGECMPINRSKAAGFSPCKLVSSFKGVLHFWQFIVLDDLAGYEPGRFMQR